MDQQELIKNGNTVHDLYYSIQEGGFGLSNTPNLIKRVISEKMWQQFIVPKTGEVIEHKNFISFVVAHPPKGLGQNIDTIKKLCEDDAKALNLLDGVIGQNQGQRNDLNHFYNNIQEVIPDSAPTGTTKQAGLRRLRSEINKASPERRRELESVQSLVLANEKSVHAALVELGIRQKTITIPLDPEKAARAIKRNFEHHDIEQLIELLQED